MNQESLDQVVEGAWKAAYALSANDGDPEAIQAAFKEYEAAVAAWACRPLVEALERADSLFREGEVYLAGSAVRQALAAHREKQP